MKVFVCLSTDILVPPESQQIIINSGMAEFYCKTVGHNSKWNVNEDTLDAENGTRNGLEFTEFITAGDAGFDNTIYDMYLRIPASLMWNTSTIVCVSFRDQPKISTPVQLIIIGEPKPISSIQLPFLNIKHSTY